MEEEFIIKLSKFLNQISQIEIHYDDLPKKIQQAYQKKAKWIIEFFEENGILLTKEIDNIQVEVSQSENENGIEVTIEYRIISLDTTTQQFLSLGKT